MSVRNEALLSALSNTIVKYRVQTCLYNVFRELWEFIQILHINVNVGACMHSRKQVF